jgi:endonuclease YncB( thermonuclease family)
MQGNGTIGRISVSGLLALLLALAAPAAAAEIVGRAVATDGDTLALGSIRIRLHGVDAPEADQQCGRAGGGDWDCGAAAHARLTELIAGRDIRCIARDRDRYGRIVAVCSAADIDLGATLVNEGLARAYTQYSRDYLAAEDIARLGQLGLWQGAALAPWDYRNAGFTAAAGPVEPASPAAAPAEAPDGCAIKGNITGEGERVYHTPASPWYGRTRIETDRGERWFCDAATAEAAGWRPVR